MIQHGKQITTTSYYDGLVASTKQEYEVSLFSTKENILKDMIDAMSLISRGETHKLALEISVEGQRYRLKKKWSIEC